VRAWSRRQSQNTDAGAVKNVAGVKTGDVNLVAIAKVERQRTQLQGNVVLANALAENQRGVLVGS